MRQEIIDIELMDGKSYKVALNIATSMQIVEDHGVTLENMIDPELPAEKQQAPMFKILYSAIKANNDHFKYSFKEFSRIAHILILGPLGELMNGNTEQEPDTTTKEGNLNAAKA